MRNDFERRDFGQELQSASQVALGEMVKSLPEDQVSLAWRSDLNARLRDEAARKRRWIVAGWIWKPTVGLAVAGALAVAFVSRAPISTPQAGDALDFEQALVNSYVDSRSSWELAGAGVTVNEARDVSGSSPAEWNPEDIGATL